MDLTTVGDGFEAVLMNPPWNYSEKEYPIFTFDHFVNIEFTIETINNT